MKLTKYLMPFAALALLASCSDDKVVDPTVHGPATTAENDLYVTMRINQLGTRAGDDENVDHSTTTGFEGEEVGKDRENTIQSALLLFVPWDETNDIPADNKNLIAASVPNGNLKVVGTPGNYAATFNILRTELLEAITANATSSNNNQAEWEYKLFFIANPTNHILAKYINSTAGTTLNTANLFNTFELSADEDWYWSLTNPNFLMSTAEAPDTKKLKIEDVAPGTHTTEGNALNLGEVKVQRAMSRFDILPPSEEAYTIESKTTEPSDITVIFDAVALVNQATSANIFKVVGDAQGWYTWINAANTYKGTDYEWFRDESVSNYVYSPDQNKNYTRYLFDENDKQLDFTDDEVFEWKLISTLNEEDNTYTYPKQSSVETDPGYKIWRYVMENTIRPGSTTVEGSTKYNDLSQQAGVSTGVAFRAKMVGNAFPETTTEGSGVIYAYHNTVAGNFEALRQFNVVEGDAYDHLTDEEQQIATRLAAALENFNKAGEENTTGTYIPKTLVKAEDDVEGEYVITEEELKPYLPAVGFTNYAPTVVDGNNVYYCYYVYWNRHNNNGDPAVMGPMEFATVRNNVYKLSVNKVVQLGHPADPDDDPDPIKPDDPDESDQLWCEITCKVLPWSVRLNGIEF